jgi:hypothetical protein
MGRTAKTGVAEAGRPETETSFLELAERCNAGIVTFIKVDLELANTFYERALTADSREQLSRHIENIESALRTAERLLAWVQMAPAEAESVYGNIQQMKEQLRHIRKGVEKPHLPSLVLGEREPTGPLAADVENR